MLLAEENPKDPQWPKEGPVIVSGAKAMILWYRSSVRKFFVDHVDAARVEAFDKDCERLQRVEAALGTELAVCMIGNSGVGKSTLINALLGGNTFVVPSGGVGPLTAQALVVRFATKPSLQVEYHGAGQLNQMIFGLEHMFKTELGSPALPADDLGPSPGSKGSVVPAPPVPQDGDSEDTDPARDEKRESMRRYAQLLISGDQNEERDLRYLLDSMREAAGGKRRWGTAREEQDKSRLEGIAAALSYAKRKEARLANPANEQDFVRIVQDHASGYLAPLIKKLELGWDSPLLKNGITLVDLPGLGVMRDAYRDVTRLWIRERVDALVLVVDHRGLHDSVGQALLQSEFLNSLIYSADEPEDDPVVLVAVTRIDDIAATRYRENKSRKKMEYYQEVATEIKGKLKTDVERSLESIWLSGKEVPEVRRQVVRNIMGQLEVYPVSSPEYLKLSAGDEDDPPFLKEAGQTGVPAFESRLIERAALHRQKQRARLRSSTIEFMEGLGSTLVLLQRQWESDGRTAAEIKRLRETLEDFLGPRRKDFHVRQGQYRSFLKQTVPQRIEDQVDRAALEARIQIGRYLARLASGSHWATLRASVKRGGAYSGATEIDLPSECALRFEEPVADIWSKKVLADIRRETRDYASATVAIVGEVAEWARTQGAKAQPELVDAKRDAIRADAKRLETVGREMVKEMRDEAKKQLIAAIEKPIRQRCEQFVKKNMHIGPGVKNRILELYGELADEVIEAAKGPSKSILTGLFRPVEKEILEAFREHDDPLESIAKALLESEQSVLKRSDAQKRKRVLDEIRGVQAVAPDLSKL